MEANRTQRKYRRGVVLSDCSTKTRCVEVVRQFRHPLYEKVLRRRKRYLVHDEKNASHKGDAVLIGETRPLSRYKHWEIIEVFNK